jgi:hypothetical protein
MFTDLRIFSGLVCLSMELRIITFNIGGGRTPTSSGVSNSESGMADSYSPAPASTSPLVIERHRASLVCFTKPPLPTYILPI